MKNIKGQIAIEYIILISILLLFFQAIIYPNIVFSENIVGDIYNITQTKQSIDKLGDDLASFASSPGYGKRLVYFYLPDNAKIISCDSATKTIEYQISISSQNPKPNISECDSATNVCTFEKFVSIGDVSFTCDEVGPGFNNYLVVDKTIEGDIDVSSR